SGAKARREANPLALAHALATQPPPDLRTEWPAAPAAAAELLMQGMSRDPGARPRSAGELMTRLREAFERRPSPAVAAVKSPVVAAAKSPVVAAAITPAVAAAKPPAVAAAKTPA